MKTIKYQSLNFLIMKRISYLLLVAITLVTLSCSSDDDSNTNSENIDNSLVGTWNVAPSLTGNTYTYNSDGSAIYMNSNGSQTWTYQGAWEIIEDNVLIEYYPDEDEEWNENWSEQPTLKRYYELLNDCTLELTNYHSPEDINLHYKENEDNCYDDMQETKEFRITVYGNSSSEEIYPLSITYLYSNIDGDLLTNTIESQTNTDVIEYGTFECFDKIGFKYEVQDNGETVINGVVIEDIDLESILFENYDLEIPENEEFIYNIHQDSYVIE